jgi:hypothetical protein
MFFTSVTNMEYTNYANFNVVTVTGRIVRSGIANGQYGEFLSVQIATTLTKDGQTAKVTFTDTGSLKSLFEAGHLGTGRQVTVTGHLAEIKSTYEENGETVLSTWPELHLANVQILDGGLGAKPKSDTGATNKRVVVKRKVAGADAPAPVDQAPAMAGTTEEMPY